MLSLKAKLKSILYNTIDGAVEIESTAIELFVSIANSKKEYWSKEIIYASNSIASRFRSMANIANLNQFIEENIDNISSRQFTVLLRGYQNDIKRNRFDTIATAAGIIRKFKTIFTLSNSGTIYDSILKARSLGWKGTGNIVESRPRNEGTIMAGKLAQKGIEVILAVDTAIPHLVAHSNAVFLGADSVTSGLFLNKIGSKIAIDYAAKFRIPSYIVFDKSKLIDIEKFPFEEKMKSSSEIARPQSKKMIVFNKYFEAIVPLGEIKYICGKKVYGPKLTRKKNSRPIMGKS